MGVGRRAIFFWASFGLRFWADTAAAADLSSLGIETEPRLRPSPGPTPISTFFRKCGSASTPTTGFMTKIRPVDLSAEILVLAVSAIQTNRRPLFLLVLRSAYQHWRDDQHRRQDKLRLHRPHLAHSDLQGVLLRGRVRRRRQHLAVADEPGRINTGCRFDFRESGGFGYQFNEHWDLIANIEHISHASLCTHINPGLTQVGVRVGV